LGVPDSGVPVSGAGVKLLGVPDSGVPVPGAGVKLLGVPDSGVPVSGAGVKLLGVPDSGVPVSGAGVKLLGELSPSKDLLSGTVVLPGAADGTGVPPGQRELRGERSHRILKASGDRLISVVELADELLDSSTGDLLDSATATLVVSAKARAAPNKLRDFPFILN
jgi:hypothetical protein